MRFLRNFFLFLLLLTGPATASVYDVEVRLEPTQPAESEPFDVLIEGRTDEIVSVTEVRTEPGVGGGELEIRLREQRCEGACSIRPFEIRAHVADSPFRRDEINDLRILHQALGEEDFDEVAHRQFAVGYLFDHPLRPRIFVDPYRPTDADSLQLLVASDVAGNDCGTASLSLERIEREGRTLSVFLRYPRALHTVEDLVDGVGAGVLLPGDEEKCTPPGETRLMIDLFTTDLGTLEKGWYDLELYLSHGHPNLGIYGLPLTLPLLADRESFPVGAAPETVALQDGRFAASVQWTDFANVSGVGKPVPGATDDSTLFTFFGSENWELLVKVLDGCGINDHFWVLTAAATTVEYEITITDSLTGEEWTFHNPLGVSSPAVSDVTAFACGDGSGG